MHVDERIGRVSKRAGFTLAEILIAMLVFAIAITTILALLARSIETVDEIVLRDEAMRLSSAVESYMRDLPFNEAYHIVSQGTFLHTMHYRARDVVRSDGTRQPELDPTGVPGVDFSVIPSVRHDGFGTGFMRRDFDARVGRYFQVHLEVSPTNPVAEGDMPANPDDYESAVIVVFAEFYPMPSPDMNYADTNSRPVYAYNFAVRR